MVLLKLPLQGANWPEAKWLGTVWPVRGLYRPVVKDTEIPSQMGRKMQNKSSRVLLEHSLPH